MNKRRQSNAQLKTETAQLLISAGPGVIGATQAQQKLAEKTQVRAESLAKQRQFFGAMPGDRPQKSVCFANSVKATNDGVNEYEEDYYEDYDEDGEYDEEMEEEFVDEEEMRRRTLERMVGQLIY